MNSHACSSTNGAEANNDAIRASLMLNEKMSCGRATANVTAGFARMGAAAKSTSSAENVQQIPNATTTETTAQTIRFRSSSRCSRNVIASAAALSSIQTCGGR